MKPGKLIFDRKELNAHDEGREQGDSDNGHSNIVGLLLFSRSVKVIRKGIPPAIVEGRRGNITELSFRARSRLYHVALETMIPLTSMITLTYPGQFPTDGESAKKDLKYFLNAYRRRFPDSNYLWILEFQKRGAPHYHILTDVYDILYRDRVWLATVWSDRMISRDMFDPVRHKQALLDAEFEKTFKVHFHRKVWEPIREGDGAARYIAKYALKMEQKEVPEIYSNVGRFWGASSEVLRPLVVPTYLPCTEEGARSFLEECGLNPDSWGNLPEYMFARGNGET